MMQCSSPRASSGSGSDSPHSPAAACRQPPEELCHHVIACMKEGNLSCMDDDPGMAIDYKDAGLQARRPNHSPQQNRAAIAKKVTDAGMATVMDANGVESDKFFRGSAQAFADAINSLCDTTWVRPQASTADVAELWQVTGNAQGATFIHFKPPFNA